MAFQSTATNVAVAGLGALTGILSARYLGPVGRGEIAIALSVLGIVVQICDLSVVQTGSYFIAKGQPAGVVFGTGTLVLLALAVLAVPPSFIVLELFGYGDHTLFLSRLLLLNVPVMLIAGLASIVPLGLGHYRAWNFCRVLMPSCFALAVIISGFVLGRWTSGALVVGYLVASVSTTILVVVVAFRYIEVLRFSRQFARAWLKYSASIHFGGLAASFNLSLDLVLIGALLSSREAGIYAVAVGFATPVTFVAASYAAIALPEIARRIGDEQYRFAFWTLKRAVGFGIGIACIGGLVAPIVVAPLLGSDFAAAVTPFRILLLAQIVQSTNGVLAAAHLGMGRPVIPTVAQFGSLAATVPLLILLLPRWGIVGAAWICVGTYTSTLVVLWATLVRCRAKARADGASDIVVGADDRN